MQTKQQIISVALDLFINNGYERTSLTDIAKQIGITKPAIYYHFKNKETLFLAVVNGFLDEMEKWTLSIIEADVSVQDMLQMMFGMLKDAKGTMAALTGTSNSDALEFHTYMLMFEGIKIFPEVRQRVDAFYTYTITALAEKIREAQAKGEVRSDIHPEAFAFQLSATLEGAFIMSIFNTNIDTAAMSRHMFENTWLGMAA